MRIILIILLLVKTTNAFGSTPVWLDPKDQAVTIVYNRKKIPEKERGLKLWGDICRQLGRSLLQGSKEGGVFASFHCEYLNPLVHVGEDGGWIVSIDQKQNNLKVNTFFQWNKEKISVHEFALTFKGKFLRDFSRSPQFIADLAGAIIESVPLGARFLYKIDKSEFKIKLQPTVALSPEARSIADLPDPAASPEPDPVESPEPDPAASPEPDPAASPEPDPAASPEPDPVESPEPDPAASPEPSPESPTSKTPGPFTVFRLGFDPDEKIWVYHLVASVKLLPEKQGAVGARYGIRAMWVPLTSGEVYWVKDLSEEARNYKAKAHNANLEATTSGGVLDDLLFGALTSNYVAIRYGKSLLAGDSIVADTTMQSVAIQMRSGLFSGVRFYYDNVPKISRDVKLGEQLFLMKRMAVGWAFNYLISEPARMIASRIDLQPKFGLVDVDYLAVNPLRNGGTSTAKFSTRSTFDLGLELGIERESNWMLSRLWASYNSSKIANPGDVSVASIKTGADIFFELWDNRGVKFGVLLFGMAEDITMVRDRKKATSGDLLGISFNLFFAGGGFTLSW